MKDWFKRLFSSEQKTPTGEVAIPASVQPFLRTCWTPMTSPEEGSAHGSKFCGAALIPRGQSWPVCGNCSQPLHLFVQLRSSDLPPDADAFGEGILQFFYCTSSEPPCEVDAEAWAPFGKSSLARILPLSAAASAEPGRAPDGAFSGRQIMGWQPMMDMPNSEELSGMGVVLNDAEAERLSEADMPHGGDKLLGWPAWIQGVEYPTCSICASTMKLIVQIDSEDNVPYMFGDVGCGHLFQCRQHPQVLGFAWACS
ncbi:MAG: DUF1963 domain-containing protein [Pseudomonadota bacterium]